MLTTNTIIPGTQSTYSEAYVYHYNRLVSHLGKSFYDVVASHDEYMMGYDGKSYNDETCVDYTYPAFTLGYSLWFIGMADGTHDANN